MVASNKNPLLAALQTDEFGVVSCCLASAEAIRSVLSRHQDVLALREGYLSKSVTEQEIRDFVDELLKEFQPGFGFGYQEILEAIAVALEPVQDAFAQEYIHDLAKVQCSELAMAYRVARVCEKNRSQSPTSPPSATS